MTPHARLCALALATLMPIATAAHGTAAAPEGPLEVPDDPPGEPARPTPGAPKAQVWRFGNASAIQVNVAANGSNIVGDAANEPSIAVDPTAPNHLAIGWRQFDTISSNFRQAGVAFSTDGGRTWTFEGVLDPGVFRSDPVLSFDAEGNFYYNSLEGNFTTDVFTSSDGGDTWGTPVYAFGGDKQWMEIDRTGGSGHGKIYQAWSNAAACCGNDIFNLSDDAALSFDAPIQIPSLPRWGTMDIAPDGTLYISGVSPGSNSVFLVARSSDAQQPGTPSFDFVQEVSLGGAISLFPAPNPEGLAGQVWIAVDPSTGPTAGFVYLVCAVDPPGSDPLDVRFSRSEDGGLTWSTPVTINDDLGSVWQWFATMDVSPDGRIDVVWNDARNTAVDNMGELFYSYSTDGGVTWSPNEQLSGVWNSHLGWPNQNKIGDYYDIVSDRVGAHLAWAATFNGEQDVYYTRIGDYDCNDNGVGDAIDIGVGGVPDSNGNGIPDTCEEGIVSVVEHPAAFDLIRNAPNPFGASTTIYFEVRGQGGNARLVIFDVNGREVRTLVDGFVPAGPYAATWDGLDGQGDPAPQGVYYARLEAGGETRSHRMLLLK